MGKKHLPVHRLIGDHRRGQSAATQSAHKGRCLPMSMWRRTDAALASGSTPVAPGHVGRSPRFIEEHELFYVHRWQSLDPRAARLLYVLAFLLAGVQGFF